jgi:hypothetical protein
MTAVSRNGAQAKVRRGTSAAIATHYRDSLVGVQTDGTLDSKRARRPGVTGLSPRQALTILAPAAFTGAALVIGSHFLSPTVVLVAASIAFLPSALVVAWGTLKFRSYYEVKRTKSDLLTMVEATFIQVLALATAAYLFVRILESVDALAG